MVYPTLLAAVADVADPDWRGAAIGVYRLWRDLGFAVGRGGHRGRRGHRGHPGGDLGGRPAYGHFRPGRPRSDARDQSRSGVTYGPWTSPRSVTPKLPTG
jgi:hypothetical protein